MKGLILTKKCPLCSSNNIPGCFQDNDSDPDSGGNGMPVCKKCLGTGLIPMDNLLSKIFSDEQLLSIWGKLSLRVGCLRDDNLSLKIFRNDIRKIKNNNLELLEIMKKALDILGRKRLKDCYASSFIQKT